ncbi:MAG TPA: 23S rRNA (adenine(2503)-C(2))-methyltransferase RlmN [Candidatus Cloacimonadota bacterium]|jgi:23S rRNA (adenine2503-C2)-methyltransferase|nr:23S rRNA (adenine(2503)-C(2))-methyltransferase RlmN [Candidatus Cloacimonadales bacterium]HPY95628.1 23S rRNA (adenine(2503)-C(2))-methyltransferase RlmN [Candidatus Cloacimonadota bacterium]HQB40196.1 23S rRNA (adenine(2503)-C(2))-methyltransferase RlmN [Candidatus Cloacimonadota bacterium]
MKTHILSLDPQEIEAIILQWGEKKYRIIQLLDWIYKKNCLSFDDMTNLPNALRERLKESFDFTLPEVDIKLKSKDSSEKYSLKLRDDNYIEMVFMFNNKKNTLCISSQVGCARNCQFCATAKIGLIRNLEVEEIVSQLLIAQKLNPENRITNIVFMGMGEPLDNYDNVVKAIQIIQADLGIAFSSRKMTLSTCGVVPAINKLADSNVKIKLAVSLNSAINEKRSVLMPINQKHSLDELKVALIEFRKKTSYRISFEYIMIKNFNMSDLDVKALIKFAGDISCKINLIKWNSVPDLPWISPANEDVEAFIKKLTVISAAVTLRQSRGEDIAAACGQLATQRLSKQENDNKEK